MWTKRGQKEGRNRKSMKHFFLHSFCSAGWFEANWNGHASMPKKLLGPAQLSGGVTTVAFSSNRVPSSDYPLTG